MTMTNDSCVGRGAILRSLSGGIDGSGLAIDFKIRSRRQSTGSAPVRYDNSGDPEGSNSSIDIFVDKNGDGGPEATTRAGGSLIKSESCRDIRSSSDLQGSGEALDATSSLEVLERLETKCALYRDAFRRIQKEKKLLKREKDAELEAVMNEVTQLEKEVRSAEQENEWLRSEEVMDHELEELREANKRLRNEWNETVQNANKIVQERETTMDKLLEQVEALKDEKHHARSLFEATLYKHKLRTETLDHETDEYVQQLAELEQLLNLQHEEDHYRGEGRNFQKY